MRIILLGPPGSGKGTQAALIQKKYGLPKISTGDLLRQAVQESTALGKKAEASMRKGGLVSDEVVVRMVADRISRPDCRKGYVLDGFPRNLHQAQKLDELENSLAEITLDIRLSQNVLVQRLSSRRICSGCGLIYNLAVNMPDKIDVCDTCGGELVQRNDDQPDVIKERLKVYHEETEPLVEYYKNKCNYHRIDGEQDINKVFQDIQSLLDSEIGQPKGTEVS